MFWRVCVLVWVRVGACGCVSLRVCECASVGACGCVCGVCEWVRVCVYVGVCGGGACV